MAISIDAQADYTAASSSTTHTFDITTSSSADYLALRVGISAQNDSVSSAALNPSGGNITINNEITNDDGSAGEVWLGYITGTNLPGAGTHTIEVTLGSAGVIVANALALAGAADQAPEVSSTQTNAFGTDNSFNNELEPLTDGSLLVDGLVTSPNSGGGYSALDGQTIDYSDNGSAESFVCGHLTANAGATQEMDYSWTNSVNNVTTAIMAIAPAASGGGATKTLTPSDQADLSDTLDVPRITRIQF